MDILELWKSYEKGADPDDILPLYQQCPLRAKTRDYGELNLLQIACQNAHPEAVIWLLEQGLKPNQVSGYADLPLYQVATKGGSFGYVPRKGDVYRTTLALLDAGANALRRDGYGRYCFHRAAQNGNVEFLRAMGECGVRLGKTDRDGNTALHLIAESYYNPLEALERVKQEIEDKRNEASLPVELRSPVLMEELEQRKSAIEQEMEDLFQCAIVLLEAGVDPEAENDMLCTAHAIAVRAGAKKLAALLDGSYDPQEDSPEKEKKVAAGGMTLHEAVRKSDAEAVRALVEMGSDLNGTDASGRTPLIYAAKSGRSEACRFLVELGADKNLADEEGHNAFDYAVSNGMRDVIALLEDTQRSTDNEGNTSLHQACYQNQTEVVEALIRAGGVDLDAPNDAGETPLLLACQNQNVYLAEILLKAGADPNRKLLDGSSPLHYAAEAGNDPIARALLAGGADCNLRNLDGETPLILAAREGRNDMTALLIENGADVNLTDNLQFSALHYATENDFTEIVEQLLMAGAEV